MTRPKSETALSPGGAVARVAQQTTGRAFRPAGLLTTLPGAGDPTEPNMTVYDPRDNCDSDSPFGCPCPHTADETSGALLWLLAALAVAGIIAWRIVA